MSRKKRKIAKNVRSPSGTERLQMVSFDIGSGYMYGGEAYDTDLVRSCIRPFANAVSKVKLLHIRKTDDVYEVYPDVVLKMLLTDPNPMMGMPALLQKAAIQYKLNSNAYIFIARDPDGVPIELYPIDCYCVQADLSTRNIRMTFDLTDGKKLEASYDDIIHLRADFTSSSPIFGKNPGRSLDELLETMGSIDKSVSNAIKNSGIIRWLLKYSANMRPEDIKENVKTFVENYLSYESETFGAAGLDVKADAQRIEPKDYVPNQQIQANYIKRIYNFFTTNEKIINCTFTEDEWNSYYEAEIEGFLIQLADECTRKIFTRRARAFGNRVVCDNANLDFASMKTKLGLTAYVDRAILSRNEVRDVLNLAPVEGGDRMLLRKDTGLDESGGGGGVNDDENSDDRRDSE